MDEETVTIKRKRCSIDLFINICKNKSCQKECSGKTEIFMDIENIFILDMANYARQFTLLCFEVAFFFSHISMMTEKLRRSEIVKENF